MTRPEDSRKFFISNRGQTWLIVSHRGIPSSSRLSDIFLYQTALIRRAQTVCDFRYAVDFTDTANRKDSHSMSGLLYLHCSNNMARCISVWRFLLCQSITFIFELREFSSRKSCTLEQILARRKLNELFPRFESCLTAGYSIN